MKNGQHSNQGSAETHCHVEVVSGCQQLEAHRTDWEELAAQALEPNPFYEAFSLLPALRWMLENEEVRILLIWCGEHQDRRLVGLVPVQRACVSSRFRMRAWMPWRHRYCFLTTPLIHRQFAGPASHALLLWLKESGPFAVLSWVGGGEIAKSLTSEAAEMNLGLSKAEVVHRAMFVSAASADEYLARSLSGRHRKGYRRFERQLAAFGKLEYKMLRNGHVEELESWIKDFLGLEASGWKGMEGTAFAARANDGAYFTELIRNAHAQNRLMGLGLYLSGKPIAMKANLLGDDGGYCFKICYDETFAKYSPGVLLELENIREMHQMGLKWMDSCADENHPMIDRLWPDRREVCTLFAAAKWCGIASPAAPIAALRRAKRRADRFLGKSGFTAPRALAAAAEHGSRTKPEEAHC